MADEIEKNVQELQHAVTVAGLNYEIWWVYKKKKAVNNLWTLLTLIRFFLKPPSMHILSR